MCGSDLCPGLEDELAVAVGAFDPALVPHLEEDARMAERAAIAVAGDAAGFGLDCLRGLDGHGLSPEVRRGRD